MRVLRQLFAGLITAIGSTLLVLAAGSLALAEGGIAPALPLISPTVALPSPTAGVSPTSGITASPQPGATLQPTPTQTQTITLTATQTEVFKCQKTPANWVPYTVKAGDTLALLASQTGLTADAILSANCLFSPTLIEGTILYLPFTSPTATVPPALPTTAPTLPRPVYPTQTPVRCGPPYGWTTYTVQAGDTLYRLSLAFGITQYQLQSANCLSGSFIYAGQRLYVPNIATQTPVPSNTPEPTVTDTLAPTAVPPTPVRNTRTPTSTQTPVPTDTETPTPTGTFTPTNTSTFTATPTNTDTPAGSGTTGATQP